MITYFVLKDELGKTAGCVRLENGRARSSRPCTLLLEDGTSLDLGADETPLPARPLGAAVLQNEALLAWGTPPGSTFTKSELLYRLKKGRPAEPKPAPQPEPHPEPEPESILDTEPEIEPAPDPEPEEAPPPQEPSDSAASAADFGLLVRHASEVYESILHPPLPEEQAEPPEEKKEDWFSDTESLLTRIRRR